MSDCWWFLSGMGFHVLDVSGFRTGSNLVSLFLGARLAYLCADETTNTKQIPKQRIPRIHLVKARLITISSSWFTFPALSIFFLSVSGILFLNSELDKWRHLDPWWACLPYKSHTTLDWILVHTSPSCIWSQHKLPLNLFHVVLSLLLVRMAVSPALSNTRRNRNNSQSKLTSVKATSNR